MGGNALKEVTTRRYQRDEYLRIEMDVLIALTDLFDRCSVASIEAYSTKESFGDLDVLVTSEGLPNDWHLAVAEKLQSKQWVKNGNVVSFEHKEFQIDVIAVPESEFVTSQNYFAFNDLGNLLGRIAHMMGLKLGHDGLSYNWRVETYQFRNVVISRDWRQILSVLGLDPEPFFRGFDTPESIFRYVASSKFFDPDIYLLHNRNHDSRTRDAKRKTYMEFLNWCEVMVPSSSVKRVADKKEWLPYLFSVLPGFQTQYEEVQAEWDQEMEFRERFNSAAVASVTGLKGPALGGLMKWIKETHASNLRKLVMTMNPEVVSAWIAHQHKTYLEQECA